MHGVPSVAKKLGPRKRCATDRSAKGETSCFSDSSSTGLEDEGVAQAIGVLADGRATSATVEWVCLSIALAYGRGRAVLAFLDADDMGAIAETPTERVAATRLRFRTKAKVIVPRGKAVFVFAEH